MSTTLSDLITELDGLLQPARFRDYCPNGLQVPGRSRIGRVATGVSAGVELFEQAIAHAADLLIVHHGLFWDSRPSAIDAAMRRRLELLFDADMSLAAYHLPLDAHPQIGNNALIAQALGARSTSPFADHGGEPIGIIATLSGDGMAAEDLFRDVARITSREPLVLAEGPERVQTVAIVSGAGAGHLQDAIDLKADAFLTGEPAERVMAQSREAGIHFIAAGHYATETFGVRRLGEHLCERFGVEHVFLDVPNPI